MLRLKAILFVVSFGICFYAQAAKRMEIVTLSTGEWAPFISSSLENNGLIAQIAKEAFAYSETPMDLQFFPWARAAELSKNGDRNGTIAFVRLPEREKVYYYSEPIYTGYYAFFHLKSSPLKWRDFSDLKDITIATTRGYGGMGDKFITAEEKGVIKVLRLTSDTQSFAMLMSERVQAVPSDIEVGYVYLRKLYGAETNKFTHHPRMINRAEYCLVISKKIKNGPEIIARFNAGLKHLHKSGRYKEILRSWYQKPIYKDSIPPAYMKELMAQHGIEKL